LPVDRRRRIDSIHIPHTLQGGLVQAHTAFVGRSDHKGVLVTLDLPPSRPMVKRKHCPTSFFSDEDAVSELKAQLSDLPHQGYGWWDTALRVVKKTAIAYQIRHEPPRSLCAASFLAIWSVQ